MARRYLKKGQVGKALREFQRIYQDNPADLNALLKIGHLHLKRGERDVAIEKLLEVVDGYRKKGFSLKAAAVLKQILKIEPDRYEVRLSLADVFEEKGLVGDALEHLIKAGEILEGQGNDEELEGVLQMILELQPGNHAIRYRLAEVYRRVGYADRAIVELTSLAEGLLGENRDEEFVRVAERVLFLNGGNVDLAKKLAAKYLELGEVKRALSKLQVCFRHEPKDLDVLTMLADSFSRLRQLSKTVSVYKEMAKIHAEAGNEEEAMQLHRLILDIEPGDVDAQNALASEQTVEEMIAEADVYINYGLQEKAIKHLELALEMEPGNPKTMERLRAICPDEPECGAEQEEPEEYELGDGDFQYSMEDVLDEFKKGVARVVGAEDSSTHFDLGIAYKEMGLLDEAISEFDIAIDDRKRRASAISMIGLCYFEKERFAMAISQFMKALYQQGITDQESITIYYNAARSYEALNDIDAARVFYQKVFEMDKTFRDVPERLSSSEESLDDADS